MKNFHYVFPWGLINRFGVQVLVVKKVVSGRFKIIPTRKYVLKSMTREGVN